MTIIWFERDQRPEQAVASHLAPYPEDANAEIVTVDEIAADSSATVH